MRETGTLQRDHLAALAIAIALHGLVGWGLARQMRAKPAAPVRVATQLLWIIPTPAERPQPSPPVDVRTRAAPVDMARRVDTAGSSPSPPSAELLPDVAEPVVTGGRPLSAVYIAQAGQWAAQQSPPLAAPAQPLGNRPSPAIQSADRFRMRESLAPADVVAIIGRTFGAGADDPCASSHRDIAAYSTGDDAMALELAIDFERRNCRP